MSKDEIKKINSEKNIKLEQILIGYLWLFFNKLNEEYGSNRTAVFTEKQIRDMMMFYRELLKEYNYSEALIMCCLYLRSLNSITVERITVPTKFARLKISELHYENKPLGARITNALKNKNVVYLQDFCDNPDLAQNLYSISGVGIGTVAEFKNALLRTIECDDVTKFQ